MKKRMEKQVVDYINGDTNVVQSEFIIGRERTGRVELITVSVPDIGKPLYELWHKRKRNKVEVSKVDKVNGKVGKSTGGKKAYVKVMLRECKGLNDAPLDVKGAVFSLFDYIEWNTGRLRNKRTGKSLTVPAMGEIFKTGAVKTRRLINDLKGLNVMTYDTKHRFYFVNPSMFAKGVNKRADSVQEGIHAGTDS